MDDIPPWSDEAKALTPGKYQHFKDRDGDHVYTVHFVARHSETGEELVVYQSGSHPDRIWVRPLKMFVEHVRRDGYEGPRFKRVGD